MKKRKLKKIEDRDLLIVTETFLTKMNTNESRINKLLHYTSKNDKEFIKKRLKTMPTYYYKEDKASQIMTNAFAVIVMLEIIKFISKTKEKQITYGKYLKGELLDEPSDE